MFDILFFSVVGLSTAFAALRGGLREMSTLLALAVAGGLTLLFAEPTANLFGESPGIFLLAGIAGLYAVVFFIVAQIGLHVGISRLELSGNGRIYDRVGGGLFGLLRGLALMGLGYLGYSYYLDEVDQPQSVRSAISQPLAAGVANFFEGFAPEDAYLESENLVPADDDVDASLSGYERNDRNGLNEIVTTVTTSEAIEATNAGATAATAEDVGATSEDPISALLEEDQAQ